MHTKTCTQCKTTKEATLEFFARSRGGLKAHCKACAKAYYEKHKDHLKALKREYSKKVYAWKKRNHKIPDQAKHVMSKNLAGPPVTCTKCKKTWPYCLTNFIYFKWNGKTCRACAMKSKIRNLKSFRGKLISLYTNLKHRALGKSKIKWTGSRGKSFLTKDDFMTWALTSPEYKKLHAAWVKSGYKKSLAPSVDRTDPDRGYTLDNMTWMTWEENHRKGAGPDYMRRIYRENLKKLGNLKLGNLNLGELEL